MAGTVTFAGINLIDGTNYSIARDNWAPAVAGQRPGQLGGYGVYSDVVETVPVIVRGPSAQQVYQNIARLTQALDESQRFVESRSNYLDYLSGQFVYKPQGSTLTASMSALVLGRADGGGGGMSLDTDFDAGGGIYFFTTVNLAFRRRGFWVGVAQSSGASSAGTNGSIVTVTISGGTTQVNSPFELQVNGFHSTSTPTISAGVLAVVSGTNTSQQLQITEAEGMTATAWTNVNSTISNARGGSVLRYTPTGTLAATSGTVALSAASVLGLPAGRYITIAAVRNNSTLVSWQLRANYIGLGATVSSSYQTIDTSSTVPRIVIFDPVSVNALGTVSLTAIASTVTSSLDIDYLATVFISNETTSIIAHDAITLSGGGSTTMYVRPASDSQYAPTFQAEGGTVQASVSYRGNIQLTAASATAGSISAAWFSTNGTNWRFTNSGGTVITNTINVTRYDAYLTPQ